jgi:hypothetical protein
MDECFEENFKEGSVKWSKILETSIKGPLEGFKYLSS